MNQKIIGSILMIIGTSIGAGMLALPVVTATQNYWMSALMLLLGWLIMTLGAYSILEVNLWFNAGTNLIGMAKATLGKWCQVLTWIVYLLLLYSLICAYLSGSSDVLHALFISAHIVLPRWLTTIIALLLLGFVVYRGISSVDIVNRGLMSIKLIAYLILVVVILPHINTSQIFVGDYHWRDSTFMVMVTSFGFATILPTLRSYLNSDRQALHKVVLYGSLLPLVIYLIWIFVVQGLIPRQGATGLVAMATSNDTNSLLMRNIGNLIQSGWATQVAKLFVSICTLTSFLNVSIGMTDFIADGLGFNKKGKQGAAVYAITFLPPLFIVLLAPGIFIQALDYAGICCVILLIVLPFLMLYFGRYVKNLTQTAMIPGGKRLLQACLLVAGVLLISQVL